jgi:RND family efflux transporter MFP subunit
VGDPFVLGEEKRMSRRKKLIIWATLVVATLLVWGVFRHSKTEAEDGHQEEASNSAPVAAIVKVERRTLSAPLTLAGAFKPFQDVDLHAKVAGYIKNIYVDVGTHVKTGQTIAVLEVPELRAELAGADARVRRAQEEIRRAQGDVARAKSTHAAVHAMYDRLSQAAHQKEGLVAQQEVDDAQAKDLGAEAQVSSSEASLDAAQQALEVAQANQKQYQAMTDYLRITAPYDGVITVRYADTGSLIAAGTSESKQAEPVVRLAQISVLRLVLPIPESIAGTIRLGDPVKVHVEALNQDYLGKVTRFADALDQQTRTMHTEIDFPNSDGRLMPGMYVVAQVAQVERKDVLTVPLEAVEEKANDQGSVLLVNPQNVLEERNVHLGVQSSNRVEVLSGLHEGDRVVVGSRSEFRNGMKITPKPIDASEPGLAGGV